VSAHVRQAAGRSLATTLYIQAAITALFALVDSSANAAAGDGWVTPVLVGAALISAGLGFFCASGNPSAWGITIAFEAFFIALGVGVLLLAGTYVVGTIVAIGALFRLANADVRRAMTAPDRGSPWAPPSPGNGQAAAYGQPPVYGPPAEFGQPPAYGPPPEFGRPPAYGPPPEFGQPPAYGQPAAYSRPRPDAQTAPPEQHASTTDQPSAEPGGASR
jgi:hypothetical protein